MSPHKPIMVDAVLTMLQVDQHRNAVYIDGTVGAGGHSAAILSTCPDCRVIGLDRDPQALTIAAERLATFEKRVQLLHHTYLEMASISDVPVDGILLDLGVSSMQLDNAERGFAFRLEGPLDMRFDPTSNDPTAADLVNELPVDALTDVLYRYGEERHSRRIAQAIVQARPLHTTIELAMLIDNLGLPRQHIHPATRTFQALRIAVNHELQAVEDVLPLAINCLKPGGRLAIITFHSLEDRIVKQYFKHEATDCICPPHLPLCTCNHQASLKIVARKPIVAKAEEVAANPRARSAKLRVAERLEIEEVLL